MGCALDQMARMTGSLLPSYSMVAQASRSGVLAAFAFSLQLSLEFDLQLFRLPQLLVLCELLLHLGGH
jgi:hypothetical protein